MKGKNNKDENETKIPPILGVVLMIVVTVVLGSIILFAGLNGGPEEVNEPSIEETEFSSEYGEQSVDLTYEEGGKVIDRDNLDLYVGGYAVDYENKNEAFKYTVLPGNKLNYVHGSEWDGEEVRLVWKPDTPDEEVLYEGTAPEK